MESKYRQKMLPKRNVKIEAKKGIKIQSKKLIEEHKLKIETKNESKIETKSKAQIEEQKLKIETKRESKKEIKSKRRIRMKLKVEIVDPKLKTEIKRETKNESKIETQPKEQLEEEKLKRETKKELKKEVKLKKETKTEPNIEGHSIMIKKRNELNQLFKTIQNSKDEKIKNELFQKLLNEDDINEEYIISYLLFIKKDKINFITKLKEKENCISDSNYKKYFEKYTGPRKGAKIKIINFINLIKNCELDSKDDKIKLFSQIFFLIFEESKIIIKTKKEIIL